ncbi:fimbrillin family protein, partial [Bacteroides congonensis]
LPGNTYKVDVTTQTDKPAIDLLYSDNAKGFAKGASGSPQLTFTHMLSQIVFNIEKDATIPTLDGLKVTFKGMNTKADFTLADGKLINAGTVADITSLMAEGATTITTIVLPATTLSDIKVVFDLNGKSYTADYPQTVLDAGRKYVHKVKLSDSNGQPVIVMEAATITDWIEVPGGDIDVDFGGGVTPPEPIEGVEVTTDKPYNETFADGQGEFTINNVTEPVAGNSVWNHDAGYHYMVASGRVGEVDYNSEGWLVSPVLKLADAKTATLTFEHAFKFGSSADLTLQVKEVGQTTWTAVAIPTYPTGSDWNFVSSGDIDLSGYVNKSIQIAFKYTSTPSSSAKWEIKNIKLTLKDNDDPDPTPTGNLVQNPGFEDWTGDLAASWDNSYNTPKAGITKSTDIKHSGNNALKQVSASSTSKIQQEVAITGGKTYRISYWFLDNDTKASTRMWSSWISGSTVLTDNKAELQQEAYSKENADWQQVTLTLKAPVTADKFRFEVRTYKQSADNLGGFIYYDDFEIVEVTQ